MHPAPSRRVFYGILESGVMCDAYSAGSIMKMLASEGNMDGTYQIE
jgi:hypothetical protein